MLKKAFTIIFLLGSFIYLKAQTSDSVSKLKLLKTVDETSYQPDNAKTLYNYPNPFKTSTTIRYSTPVDGKVSLKVYDAQGRKVVTLVNNNKPAGTYEVNFEGADLTPGIYYYELKIGKYREIERCLVE
jgi:hypothetical protein